MLIVQVSVLNLPCVACEPHGVMIAISELGVSEVRPRTLRAMGQIFHPYERDQDHLFPPEPRHWLSEGHLAFFVSNTVDELDLRSFYPKFQRRSSARGNLVYEPGTLPKVLIY